MCVSCVQSAHANTDQTLLYRFIEKIIQYENISPLCVVRANETVTIVQ